MAIHSIRNLNVAGKRVLMRADFNVKYRMSSGAGVQIRDDFRLRATLPALRYAQAQGAKIILASHLGSPKGEKEPELSLKPVAAHLSRLLGEEVGFVDDCIGSNVERAVEGLPPGKVLLLENLRYYKGEEQNDSVFASHLRKICDVYINDAFGTSHRAHASMDALPRLVPERGIGLLVEKELENLGLLKNNPPRPFVAVLGGSKIKDKIPVIRALSEHADLFLLCGAMAYTFLKARGFAVGNSLVEDEYLPFARELEQLSQSRGFEIGLPWDHVVGRSFAENTEFQLTRDPNISEGWMGLDIGPQTIFHYRNMIMSAGTVFLNGTAGVFQWENFRKGTQSLAEALAECSGKTVVGGGDGVDAINELRLGERMSFLSTGGGASLKFISGEPMPGLLSLET